nr:8700_t:CDS:2 [Entrophospora candida]
MVKPIQSIDKYNVNMTSSINTSIMSQNRKQDIRQLVSQPKNNTSKTTNTVLPYNEYPLSNDRFYNAQDSSSQNVIVKNEPSLSSTTNITTNNHKIPLIKSLKLNNPDIQDLPVGTCLFLKNLFLTNNKWENLFYDIFSQYGEILQIFVNRNVYNHALIQYKNVESVKNAIEKENGRIFNGSRLVLEVFRKAQKPQIYYDREYSPVTNYYVDLDHYCSYQKEIDEKKNYGEPHRHDKIKEKQSMNRPNPYKIPNKDFNAAEQRLLRDYNNKPTPPELTNSNYPNIDMSKIDPNFLKSFDFVSLANLLNSIPQYQQQNKLSNSVNSNPLLQPNLIVSNNVELQRNSNYNNSSTKDININIIPNQSYSEMYPNNFFPQYQYNAPYYNKPPFNNIHTSQINHL